MRAHPIAFLLGLTVFCGTAAEGSNDFSGSSSSGEQFQSSAASAQHTPAPVTTVVTTPRISMWSGKVAQHNVNGTWLTDPDGSSSGGDKLTYCRKWWPSTTAVQLLADKEIITFYTAGNAVAYESAPINVYECVGANTPATTTAAPVTTVEQTTEGATPTTVATPDQTRRPGLKKIKKLMELKIRWDTLNRNPTLKAKVKQSLKTDVATNLAVSERDIINDRVVENTKIQVTTASAAGRRFAAQASTGSGVTYEFELQTEDEDKTTAAAAAFDTKVSSNDFAMTSTSTTTSTECSTTCTETSANSRTLTTQSSAPNAASPGSGGLSDGAIGGIVAGCVACVIISAAVAGVLLRSKASSNGPVVQPALNHSSFHHDDPNAPPLPMREGPVLNEQSILVTLSQPQENGFRYSSRNYGDLADADLADL